MSTADLDPPAVALAFGAHPDDVEINAGGTLAKWVAAGTVLHVCICTDGSKGSWDPGVDPAELAAARVREQQAALDALGGGTLHWLGAVDGELHDALGLRERAAGVIRAVRPNVVLAHDPWKRYRIHPDHEQAGRLAIGAIVGARDPHFFAPSAADGVWRPDTLLLFEAQDVDHTESIVGFHDAKADALLAHRSQWVSTFGITPDDPADAADLDTFRRRFVTDAVERFHRIDDL